MITIVPAIIPSSRQELLAFLASLPSALEIHVDLVDGVFVPFTSWPIGSLDSAEAIFAPLEAVSLEVDLMTAEPLRWAEWWLKAGADSLVFHAETLSPEAFRAFADSTGVSLGIASNLAYPLEKLALYAPFADYFQVMGIREIGAQGQPFAPEALARIEALCAQYPKLPISVDGSVNDRTLPSIMASGANRAVVGSYITRAENPQAAYEALLTISSTAS